jgi:hypothetical protein
MPDAIDIWRTARELVCWRGTDAPQYVAQKAAEARDEHAWAFYGDDVLNLVVARGYLAKLLKNPNVARYLERHQADIVRELQDLIETIGQEHTGAA